ncbi:hypothetical protein [Streptomyces albipurpureus]|uniref:Uncharacterized protein n=1 Tax=Streptomyces albipurpureus TaxID=2897419 RepID=A0ABT0UVH0_9ACTN|nr:hypothetical protein [Streptomyces sp. CWNU-1]MCM2392583.1 hypothetical protein [Streptomyces sp. CWNU-1]
MKTWRTRSAALAAAALTVVAGSLLAGCSSGDDSATQAPRSPSTPGLTASTTKAIDAGALAGHPPSAKGRAI